MKNIPDIEIQKCGFSVRLTNALLWSGYKTTRDILKKPIQDLLPEMLSKDNFGKKSAEELTDWVHSIHSLNSSDFVQKLEQLKDLYDLQAQIKKEIIEKQKQMDDFISKIEPDAYYYADAVIWLAKKGIRNDANSLAAR